LPTAVPATIGALFALSAGTAFKTTVAIAAGLLILKIGFGMLSMFAQPTAEPPPPGELRKVKIVYRCDICGTEVRMTTANDEVPDPPKHCLEEMTLVAPVDD
jgi:hypothetical protein